MFYNSNSLNTLHIEISTKCNASCPMCSRNIEGSGVNSNILVKNMTLTDFKEFVSKDTLLSLSRIMFCGNFGDPLMNSELVDFCEYIKSIQPNMRLEVHTNGGAGSKETWKALARFVHFCRFGIDGLSDLNHIYRKGVNWSSLMRNVETFIEAGGVAEWAFLIFKHNSHQIEEAQKLSEKIGFKKFLPKMTSRYYSSSGQIQTQWPVRNSKNDIEYYLEPPDSIQFPEHYAKIQNLYDDEGRKYSDYIQTTEIKCKVKNENSIYMDVHGQLFPCCWLAIDYTLVKNKEGTVRSLMKSKSIDNRDLIPKSGDLEDTISNRFFDAISQSWTSEDRIKKCAHVCGSGFDPFESQFKVKMK